MRKIKAWLIDKYHWLQTFNTPPKLIINGDVIRHKGQKDHSIEMYGRMIVEVNGDVILK